MLTPTKDVPITVDREIMSGVPVFTGTRVPVSALLENLEAGVSLDEFLDNFRIVSVQDMGWAGVKNGQLLRLVAAEFDVVHHF